MEKRIENLGTDVYTYIFQMLDAEHDMQGDEAGLIASKVASLFQDMLNDWASCLTHEQLMNKYPTLMGGGYTATGLGA